MSSFRYDKEQWARKYCDGIIDPPSAAMLFGNEVGERLASDPTFLPEVKRYPVFEQKFEAKTNGLRLIGFLDSYDPVTHAFLEYKTSSNKKKWTQKSVDEHGQILFYMFLIWLNHQVPPEKIGCELFYIPVRETNDFGMELAPDPIKSFKTKKTTLDVLMFGKEIINTYNEMLAYAEERIPRASAVL